MKKVLILLVTIFTLTSFANASHVIGGDIQIEWISANTYKIKLRFYRDDINGSVTLPTTMTVGIYDAVTHAARPSVTLALISSSIVQLGDPCYTPDPNVTKIEEGIYETTTNVTIPDNPNGYYLSSQITARNNLALNVTGSSGSGTMLWFTTMADPAIGQNSSPDFGDYPADAYLCVNSPKIFSYPITDADGDSLAYSLVTPLDANSATNGTGVGVGVYPFYPNLIYQTGYSFANMVGGVPMTMDANTGEIIAEPSAQGFFTFAIKVEEFRDLGTGTKVKIGEVRRDVQYASLNCTAGNPPSFLNVVPIDGGALNFPYNYETCKDLIFNDINTTDTLYIEVLSDIFDSNAYIATMIPDVNGDYTYFYNGNNGINPPTIWNDSVVISPNQTDAIGEWNIGTIATRFCWTPKCNSIGKSFPFQINAFSLGCDGRTQDSILFDINVVPPVVNLRNPGSHITPYGQKYCRDITFVDSSIVDILNIELTSDIFSYGAEYPSLSNSYEYNDTVTTGVANNAPNTKSLGTRICWTPDCEQIGGTYNVRAVLSSLDCPTGIKDTIYFNYSVTPPYDSTDVIPNIFTPNGDGMNDTYTLGYINDNGERVGGISNPCNDKLSVEIYNRWGLLVYETAEPTFQWNGTDKGGRDLAPGTYFVIIKGTYGSETIIQEKRTITLLR